MELHVAEEHAGTILRHAHRWRAGACESAGDLLADEVPVAFVYNRIPFAVMMATPLDLEDFALGFSLGERVIGNAGELAGVTVSRGIEGIELQLDVPDARAAAIADRARLLEGRSGCGLCGSRRIEEVLHVPRPVADGQCFTAAALQRALARMRDSQPLNLATGATHAAAFADASGHVLLAREDVGRHNALDKLIGAMARTGVDAGAGFALVTSRASYELVVKAATAGITSLAAISAPTALAVSLADHAGLTLVAFARDDAATVYSHPQRFLGARTS